MSQVRAFLEVQDTGFINLHDLLLKISDTDGCTLSEAAILLLRLFNRKKDERPHLCLHTVSTGVVNVNWNSESMFARLEYVALSNRFEEDYDIPF